MFKSQRIRDPLHNLIEFEAGEFESALWEVVCCFPFQRLRRVKQLGFSDFVYPGASHSRFAHSIGVFHIARQLMKIVHKKLGSEYRSRKAEAALAAALVHDVGHGAFSHAFEDVGKRLGLKLAGKHEDVTDLLVRKSEIGDKLNLLGSGFAEDVADVIKRGPSDIYSAVVSSQFDADRLDYMQRDRLMSGSQHAAIDFVWLMSNLEIDEVESGVDESAIGTVPTFVLGPKAIHAAEAYVLGLFQLYPTLYFHKATRGAEKLFSELLIRIIKLAGTASYATLGLPKSHPLLRFAVDPENVDRMLALDDSVIWGALAQMSEAKDPLISEFASRLWKRDLWKAIDIRGRVVATLSENPKLDKKRVNAIADLACSDINVALEKVRDKSKDLPSLLCDQTERVPYKQFDESKGMLNQILVRDVDERLVDLRTKSSVVGAIETFKLNRAYIRSGDDESAAKVDGIVKQGIENAKSRAK